MAQPHVEGYSLISGSTVMAVVQSPTTTITTGPSFASPITKLIIAGQTLTRDDAITVGGDVLSLAPMGEGITVVDTVPLRPATAQYPTLASTQSVQINESSVSVSFTMPGGQPLVRDSNFVVSWDNTSPNVSIYLIKGAVPIGSDFLPIENGAEFIGVGNEGPKSSPMPFYVNSSYPLGLYFFSIFDQTPLKTIPKLRFVNSKQYTMIDVVDRTATPVSSTTSIPSASETNKSYPNSLSTSAKAGIGIASTAGAILILTSVIWFAIRQRRRRRRRRNSPTVSFENFEKPELCGESRKKSLKMDRQELDGRSLNEIDSRSLTELE